MKRAASRTPLEVDAVLASPRRRAGRRGPRWRGCRRRPGAYGQPPVPPVEASKQRTPAVEPGDDVGERRARACRGSGSAIRSSGMPAPATARRSARATWPGTPTPIVSPKQTSSAPSSSSAQGDLDRRGRLDAAGVRAAERGRDVRPAPPAEVGRARARTGANASSDSVDGHADVALGEGVGRRGEDGERVGAGGLGPRRGRARSGRAPGSGRRSPRAARRSSSSASASWGIARGETKLVASISRRPAATSSSMKRELVAGRDRRRLVLEAVARPDLVDPDVAVGHRLAGDAVTSASASDAAAGPWPARSRAISDLDPRDSSTTAARYSSLPSGAASRRRRAAAWSSSELGAGLRAGSSGTGPPCVPRGAVPRRRHRSTPVDGAAAGRGATWSPTRTRELGDATRRRRDDDVLHLHRLERRRADRPASTASPDRDVDREDRARHRRVDARRGRRRAWAGRPGGPVDVGRRREPEGDAPAVDVDVDDAVRADARPRRPALPAPATSGATVAPAPSAADGGSAAARSAASRPASGSDRPGAAEPPRAAAAPGRRPASSARAAPSPGGQIRSSVSIRASPSRTTRLPDEPAQEAQVRDQPEDDRLVEGPREPRRAPRARSRAVGDDLGEHRVEARADHVADRDPGVHPDRRRRAASASASTRPVAGQEAGLGVLGVEADLDRVAAGRGGVDLGLAEPERLARRDRAAGRRRGRARSPARSPGARPGAGCSSRGSRTRRRSASEELARAGADVADRARRARSGGLAEPRAQPRVDGRRRRLLEHLLVAALERAVALAEVDAVRRARRTGPGPRRGAAPRGSARGSGGRRRRRRRPRAGRRRARPASSASSRTTRIPLPPPPAAGLTSSGKPIRRRPRASAASDWSAPS